MNDTCTPFHSRSRQGFTLVELLTVIGIIAVLMGILLPTVAVVKQSARKAQAKSDCVMIVNAIQAFYTEYGRYPLPDGVDPGGNDVIFGNEDDEGDYKNKQIMDVLRAEDDGKVNTRNKVFLEGTVAKKAGRYGIQTTGGTKYDEGTFLDPWGVPYVVCIDTSYSKVTETYIDQYQDTDVVYVEDPTSGEMGIRAGAIAFSFGKDGQQGKKGNKKLKGSDDVVSWE